MAVSEPKTYSFRAKIWKHQGPAAWCFVTLPKVLSTKIRKNHGLSEEGWGRLKATAKIGKSTWNTAIWYDSKFQSYLLPVKSTIRKLENVEVGAMVSITLAIQAKQPIALVKI
jgi:hypothetical protein